MNFNHKNFPKAFYCVLGGVALLLNISGCGNSEEQTPRAAVRGFVMLDDYPLEAGIIRFIPTGESKGFKTSATIIDGAFELDKSQGPPACLVRIEIESTDNGRVADDDELGFEQLKKMKSKKRKQKGETVPAAYNSRSTITEELSSEGVNELKYDLLLKPKKK